MKQRLSTTLNMEQTKSFAVSCLPRTTELAKSFKSQIFSAIEDIGGAWPYSDRVLAWLIPSLAADVNKFHMGTGPDMGAIFTPHQLESIDQALCTMLAKRLDGL